MEVEGRQGYSVQHSHKQHQAQFVSYDGKQRLSKSQRYFPKRQSVGVPILKIARARRSQAPHSERPQTLAQGKAHQREALQSHEPAYAREEAIPDPDQKYRQMRRWTEPGSSQAPLVERWVRILDWLWICFDSRDLLNQPYMGNRGGNAKHQRG